MSVMFVGVTDLVGVLLGGVTGNVGGLDYPRDVALRLGRTCRQAYCREAEMSPRGRVRIHREH